MNDRSSTLSRAPQGALASAVLSCPLAGASGAALVQRSFYFWGQVMHNPRVLCAITGLAMIAGIVSPTLAQPAPAKNIVIAVLKFVGVVATAKAAEEAGISVQDYWKDTARPGESIYSAEFKFDAMSWADIFSNPDVFMVVEYEGGKSVLIPDIENNWNGQQKIYTFRCPTMPAGSRCLLRLYDDDSTSNAVWNGILGSKFQFEVQSTTRVIGWPKRGDQTLDLTARANGSFQILDTSAGKTYSIDPPDAVATASFVVPSTASTDRWKMAGSFVHNDSVMGRVDLTHWYTNDIPKSLWFVKPSFLFWSVLAIGIFAILRWNRTKRPAT